MSEIVFILGAGASAEGGAPVMREFLDAARAIHRNGRTGDAATSFSEVFEGIAALGAVYEKAEIDTDNLEDVFAAFEMAELFGALGTATSIEPARLSRALRTVIIATLEDRLRFPVVQSGKGGQSAEAPSPYPQFVDLALSLKPSVGFITFNYDLALDYALVRKGVQIDYGVTTGLSGDAKPLIKLHGSMNWTRCRSCGIAVYPLQDFLGAHPLDLSGSPRDIALRISQWLGDPFEHCADSKESLPLLVPPTWSKGQYHSQIDRVWRSAAQHLREARAIVMIGYSLPASDQFFRYLYALGTVGPVRLERLILVNPDKTVAPEFRKLLGSTARPRLTTIEQTFSQSVPQLDELLRRV